MPNKTSDFCTCQGFVFVIMSTWAVHLLCIEPHLKVTLVIKNWKRRSGFTSRWIIKTKTNLVRTKKNEENKKEWGLKGWSNALFLLTVRKWFSGKWTPVQTRLSNEACSATRERLVRCVRSSVRRIKGKPSTLKWKLDSLYSVEAQGQKGELTWIIAWMAELGHHSYIGIKYATWSPCE